MREACQLPGLPARHRLESPSRSDPRPRTGSPSPPCPPGHSVFLLEGKGMEALPGTWTFA